MIDTNERRDHAGRPRRLPMVVALVLLFGGLGAMVIGPLGRGGDGPAVERWIVVLHDARADAPGIAKAHGLAPTHVYGHAIRGFAAAIPDAVVARLRANAAVAYVEKDGVAHKMQGAAKRPDKPGGGPPGGGGEDPPAPQQLPYGIARVGGGQSAGPFGTAWVIDTGVDLDNPDLNVDVASSANFVSRGKQKSPGDDGEGHGTHVAGTIAAIDNDRDVIGVAPGATVVAVRVLDNSGSGSISDIVKGIDYVAANGAPGDVANMSLGGRGHWQSMEDAIKAAADKGIRFAIAAGNSADDANDYCPADVDHPGVYTVSAIDANDDFASFSNYGNPPVDWAAPGVAVLSLKKGGGVETLNGTSMATPHVAGLLLLGPIQSDGTANGDPDGTPDPIAHH